MVQALKERAERAERERYLLAEQARADERARLAGEMHDVVTHRVSLMVLQAGALGITATDEATRRAAEELRAAGCQALDELRDLVGILRTAPDGDQTPVDTGPGRAGRRVDGRRHPGRAGPGRRPGARLPGGRAHGVPDRARGADERAQARARRACARAGQLRRVEGPAQRHAIPRWPAGAGSDLAATGSGLGLASLRQRIELVHGTLRAGPTADGGFCLEATLPAYVPTAEPAA